MSITEGLGPCVKPGWRICGPRSALCSVSATFVRRAEAQDRASRSHEMFTEFNASSRATMQLDAQHDASSPCQAATTSKHTLQRGCKLLANTHSFVIIIAAATGHLQVALDRRVEDTVTRIAMCWLCTPSDQQ